MWKAILLAFMMAEPTLVPGTTMTYTDGTHTWAGNPYCAEAGMLVQPPSEAIDFGGIIPDFHCPVAGPSKQNNSDGSPCVEWYGKAPDAGACEYVPGGPSVPPATSVATLLGKTGEDIAGTSSEGADGVPDVHIRMTNVPAAITKVNMIGESSGEWETPLSSRWPDCCWIVAIKATPDPSIVDLYFDYSVDNALYLLNLNFANGAAQTVKTVSGVVTPTVPQTPSNFTVTVGQ